MDANYSKLTVAQLRQKLMDKGVKMPSKVKKLDLVSRLLKEDSNNRPMPGTVVFFIIICYSPCFRRPCIRQQSRG